MCAGSRPVAPGRPPEVNRAPRVGGHPAAVVGSQRERGGHVGHWRRGAEALEADPARCFSLCLVGIAESCRLLCLSEATRSVRSVGTRSGPGMMDPNHRQRPTGRPRRAPSLPPKEGCEASAEAWRFAPGASAEAGAWGSALGASAGARAGAEAWGSAPGASAGARGCRKSEPSRQARFVPVAGKRKARRYRVAALLAVLCLPSAVHADAGAGTELVRSWLRAVEANDGRAVSGTVSLPFKYR
jgi:hypothetical protein